MPPATNMPPHGRTPLLPFVGAAVVFAAWLFAARASLEVGFLADDFEVGALLAEREALDPSPWSRFLRTFREKFGERFQVYRPVTILTVEADYALHGPNGGAHHATNALLWLLAALAAARVAAELARRGGHDDPDAAARAARTAGAVAFAFGLGSAAAVEALGWLVAREDLLVAAAGLAALGAQLRRPGSPWAPIPWLVIALMAKDSAIVLPPCLVWARFLDAAAGGRGAPEDAAARPLRPLAATLPLFILGAYFALRKAVFGTIGTTYLDRTYGEWLADGNAPRHFLVSLGRLIAPWNDAWAARHGVPEALRAVLPAAYLALLAAGLGRAARRRGDLLRTVAILPTVCAAPALTAPLYEVAATLQQGRTLTLSSFAFAALLGFAAARAREAAGRRGRVAAVAATGGALWATVLLWFNLGPFVAVSTHVAGVLDALATAGPDRRAVLAGAQPAGGTAPALRQELITFDGAYSVSGAIGAALSKPFRAPPIAFDASPPAVLDPVSGVLMLKDARRAAFFRAEPASDEPCGPGEPRVLLWHADRGAPASELARLRPERGAVEIPPNDLRAARMRVHFLAETGRAEAVDLGRAPEPGAAPREASLPPAALERILRGSPRYVLWRVVAEAQDGGALAEQAPRVFMAR